MPQTPYRNYAIRAHGHKPVLLLVQQQAHQLLAVVSQSGHLPELGHRPRTDVPLPSLVYAQQLVVLA